jgi:hypothetical protein
MVGQLLRLYGFGRLVIAMALAALIGCEGFPVTEPEVRGVQARNETSETLTFEVELPDRSISLPPPAEPSDTSPIIRVYRPGPDLVYMENGCTTGDVVARNPAGREVARHPPGLCLDELWIVRELDASPSQ